MGIQALRALVHAAKQNGDGNAIIICLLECLLCCLQDIMEYVNKWAYIYVVVYGYSYCEAGKKVMELFSDRGWEAIITDDLAGNALLIVSIIVGLICGVVGLVVARSSDWFVNIQPEEEYAICFGIGFIVGIVL